MNNQPNTIKASFFDDIFFGRIPFAVDSRTGQKYKWEGETIPGADCMCRSCKILGELCTWPYAMFDAEEKRVVRMCPECGSTDIDVFRIEDYDNQGPVPLDDRE